MKDIYAVIKFIFVILLLIFLQYVTSLNSEESINNPFDYARITDVDYKARLVDEPNSNAKVIVTERLTFDIHAASANNLFWELWRDLPEDYIDGLKVEYKVNSVKQIHEDGSSIIYKQSPKLYWDDYDYVNTTGGYGPGKWFHSRGPYDEDAAQYECVFFYVDGLYREKVTFEIEYEMSNAALRYNDVSELYLTLYSEDTIKYLKSFKGQILIPNKDMPSVGNYEAHTYGTNSHSFPFSESKSLNPGYHTFSFELNEEDLKFKSYNQYIEFSLLAFNEDKHIFTDYAPNNLYYNDDVLEELRSEQAIYESLPNKSNTNKTIILILSIVSSILLLRNTFTKEKKIRKKYNFYEPTMMMQDYFRDIPSNLDPYFAAELVFSKHKPKNDDTNGYAAVMLSLVRKKYIELEKINNQGNWQTNNVKIVVKYRPVQTNEVMQKAVGIMNLDQPIQQINLLKPQSSMTLNLNQSFQPELIKEPIEVLEINPTNNNLKQLIEKPIIEYPKLEPLTETEQHYFNLIVRYSYGIEITMNSFQSKVSTDYDNTNTFVKNMENSIVNIGVSHGYFQKADYKQPQKELQGESMRHMVIGILLVTLVNYFSSITRLDLAFGAFFILGISFIISSIKLNKISKKYILLTQYGEDEYAKWRGLYNFLNSATLINERTVIELPIWEQYLVYATAFGISEKVIKALEIRCPEVSESPILSNNYYRSNNFRSSNRSFRSATRSATRIARSGGYGGGSHYGGGGRGGGGGGGGH